MAPQDGWTLPAARPCPPEMLAELMRPAGPDAPPFRLTCRATLPPGAAVTRRLLIEGAEASGAGLDCGGGSIGRAGAPTTTQAPTIAVWSRRVDGPTPTWSRPTDVTIRDCTVHGAIRIWGQGAGGDIDSLRASSRRPGHTARARAAAPSHVTIEGVTFAATGSIPLYVGPGVTRTQVRGARFTGRSVSTAVYLDAESAETTLEGSEFDLTTAREVIAVDGSARNRIVGNRFDLNGRGGVFLYRNCGEDGVVRHQTPSDNVVTDNAFEDAGWLRPRAVVIGAREGNRRYCDADAGLPFGSSLDDGDNATGNIVARNRVSR